MALEMLEMLDMLRVILAERTRPVLACALPTYHDRWMMSVVAWHLPWMPASARAECSETTVMAPAAHESSDTIQVT